MDFEDNNEDTHTAPGTYTIPVDGWYQSSLEPYPRYREKGDAVDLDNVTYFVRVK